MDAWYMHREGGCAWFTSCVLILCSYCHISHLFSFPLPYLFSPFFLLSIEDGCGVPAEGSGGCPREGPRSSGDRTASRPGGVSRRVFAAIREEPGDRRSGMQYFLLLTSSTFFFLRSCKNTLLPSFRKHTITTTPLIFSHASNARSCA